MTKFCPNTRTSILYLILGQVQGSKFKKKADLRLPYFFVDTCRNIKISFIILEYFLKIVRT